MGLRKYVGCAVVSGVIGLAATPVSAGAPDRDVVAFVALEPGRIIVPAYIDGAGPFRLLLDTGSSGTMVSDEAARRLGASPVAKAPVTTSVGTLVRPVVQLTAVQVGSASVAELLAISVPDLSSVVGTSVDGILGQDFLSHFNYTLDFKRRQLLLNEMPESPQAVRLPLRKSYDRFIVDLPQGDGRRTVAFVPDSGADALIVFAGETQALALTDSGARFRLDTLAGERSVRGVTISRLDVGQVALKNQPAVEVPAPADGIERGNGLLPLSLFARVSFNHRDGYLVVERR